MASETSPRCRECDFTASNHHPSCPRAEGWQDPSAPCKCPPGWPRKASDREPEVLWEGEAGEGVHHQRYRVLADGTIESDSAGSWQKELSQRIAAGSIVHALAAERSRLEGELEAKADEVAVLAGELDEAYAALRAIREKWKAAFDSAFEQSYAALLSRLGAGGEEE